MADRLSLPKPQPDRPLAYCDDLFDLLSAPGHLLRRNDQRALEIFQNHVGNGITRQQFALLVALQRRPDSAQKDLVEATGIDKSTIKEMVGRMVGRKWIAIARDPNDNRAWAMRLTEEGQSILTDHSGKAMVAQREILLPLSRVEQQQFMRHLRCLLSMPRKD